MNRKNYETEFVYCKVGSDEATGIHYGVETCEACKVFFRRFLFKYTKYSCTHTNNNCEINKNTRNDCKHCRFKKCVSQGMSIQNIKLGRYRSLINYHSEDDDDCIIIEGEYFFCFNQIIN